MNAVFCRGTALIRAMVTGAFLFSWLIALCCSRAWADEENDRTRSPYFMVMSDERQGTEALPLRKTSAAVSIAGVIADVKVTQVYKNEGKNPIEAVYVFPGSTRAAVYGMKMTIGDRVRIAQVKEKQQAKQEYEQAKSEGKSASLLEQHRSNVFKMNVANIMPGDEIIVELSYTELLIPEEGVYEFVYPTVVGPRYHNQNSVEGATEERNEPVTWVKNPYLSEGQLPTYSFDLKTSIRAGMPIQEITSSTHAIQVSYSDEATATVNLAPSEEFGGNRDVILKYRLRAGAVQSGLLLHEGEKENFFLMMLEPPARMPETYRIPREYIYVIDVSGSMYGFPLEITKTLMGNLIKTLRPEDTFNVILFAASSSMLSDKSLPATPENLARAIRLIEQQRGGGGTEILQAIDKALNLPRDEQYSRTIVLATDGYVTVETEAFDRIRNNLGQANVFAFGIGSSVNRELIEGLARAGYGEPFIITKPEEALAQATRFQKYIQNPVLQGIQVSYNGFDVYDVEPLSIPDLLAERPLAIFGKWRGTPRGSITITGNQGTLKFAKTIDVSQFAPLPENSALRYLWARHRIASLSDYQAANPGDQRTEQITNLGLNYNLLTQYTSFVAIDDVVRNKEGQPVTVKQPLPLPQGVSNLAVESVIPTAPEPEEYALMAVLMVMLLWYVRVNQLHATKIGR